MIAVMGHSFEVVKAIENSVAMWHQAQVRAHLNISQERVTKSVTTLRRDCAQTIVEYERLLVGLGVWKPTDPKKFPRYMEIAQEVRTVANGSDYQQ